jgi:hypothetical protein
MCKEAWFSKSLVQCITISDKVFKNFKNSENVIILVLKESDKKNVSLSDKFFCEYRKFSFFSHKVITSCSFFKVWTKIFLC